MAEDITVSLGKLGYPYDHSGDVVKALLEDGLSSLDFYKVVEWLGSEVQELFQLESCVTAVSDIEDSGSFLLEVRTLLKELQCPYDCLVNGPISKCLEEKQNRILLLDYLCGELFSAKIKAFGRSGKRRAMEVLVGSTHVADCLSSILETLEVNLENENASALFTTIHNKLEEIISKNPEAVKEPVLTDELTDHQWAELQKIQEEMYTDYSTRKEMLVTRLNVIFKSFKWGENMKEKERKLNAAYAPLREEINDHPSVNIPSILAARKDILVLEKTSSAAVRKNMQSDLYKVLIPAVPDRGGRPNEQRPPVEMPSWQKRSDGPGGRGGGGFRGRGGGGRGDRRGGGGDRRRGGSDRRGGGGGSHGGGFHQKGSISTAYDAMGSYGSS